MMGWYEKARRASLWKWCVGILSVLISFSFYWVMVADEEMGQLEKEDERMYQKVADIPLSSGKLVYNSSLGVEIGNLNFPVRVTSHLPINEVEVKSSNELILAKDGYRYVLNGQEDLRNYSLGDDRVGDVLRKVEFSSYVYDSFKVHVMNVMDHGVKKVGKYGSLWLGMIVLGSVLLYGWDRKDGEVSDERSYIGNMVLGIGLFMALGFWFAIEGGVSWIYGSGVFGLLMTVMVSKGFRGIRRSVLSKVS